MITISRGLGDAIEDSTALRKSEGSGTDPNVELWWTETEIDFEVVSSVRSDLWRDRLKSWNAARPVTTIVPLNPLSSPSKK